MKAKRNKGFTLAELITVVVIIAVLLGVLMPALSYVKKLALETKQRAQITSIEAGILIYKNDFGSYPPSHGWSLNSGHPAPADHDHYEYCGAQTLAEAMFGWDLLGVHTNTVYKADGTDNSAIPVQLYPPNPPASNLNDRKGPYLDRTNIGAFTTRQVFGLPGTGQTFSNGLMANRYVISDVFTSVSRNIDLNNDGTIDIKPKIGTPILYYRANPSAINTELTIPPGNIYAGFASNTYNYYDNDYLTAIGKITDDRKPHPLRTASGDMFFGYICDPMIPASAGTCGRPVRPDSFLLISAGFDGLYGTKDDICNFTPNLQ